MQILSQKYGRFGGAFHHDVGAVCFVAAWWL